MKVKFTIPGEPKGKGRPRFVGNGHQPITPKGTVEYENLVRLEYQRQCNCMKFPDNAQLDMRITAYFAIPKSTSQKKHIAMLEHKIRPTKKPDMDNIVKAIADSLNKIAYRDDSQIVDCQIRKFYGEWSRVVVTIQEASTY